MHTLRDATRTLLRAPSLTAVIVLSVALGIGVNTAIFSFLGGTVFRPLPGVTADVLTIQVNQGGRLSSSSWLEYRDLRARLAPLADVVAQTARSLYIENGASTERVWSEFVSDNFFSALGVRPVLGRFFLPEEASAPGSAAVVVISDGFWQKHFAGSRDVLGQIVRLNNQPFTVIGVAPPGFKGGLVALAFDVWVPFTMATLLAPDLIDTRGRDLRPYQLDAVLRAGITPARAQAELDLTARSLAADFPGSNREITFRLLPIWRGTRAGAILMPVYATLQLFALLVLAIVCINTTNLLLARATVRRREIGIRLAIGAGPGRILRLLLSESLLLALAGTALGVVLALWGVDAVRHLPLPTGLPIQIEAALDERALVFAASLGLACGLLFGLAPALQLAQADVLPALRRGAGAISGRSRFRDLLVGAEIAGALVVLVLAGLFYKSYHNALSINPGYDVERVLLGALDLGGRGYSGDRRLEFVRHVQARLLELPNVVGAAVAFTPPLDLHGLPKTAVTIDGVKPDSDATAQVLICPTTPGYFATMGIPLVAGSDLAPLEQSDRPLDAVINEAMAARFWPGRSPLGHRFTAWTRTFEVVGVARNTNYELLAEAPQPAVWPTVRVGVPGSSHLFVRTQNGSPLALLPATRKIVRDFDPGLVIYDGRTLAQHIDNNLAIQRVSANFLSALAPVALLLASIGLYAVLAYAVAQRTQEIGVRLTLGATPRGIVFEIVRQGMQVVALGCAFGLLAALTIGWYLRPKLIAVPFGDPAIYVGIPALLLVVSVFACWLPARRAAEVDPMTALRSE